MIELVGDIVIQKEVRVFLLAGKWKGRIRVRELEDFRTQIAKLDVYTEKN